MKFKSFIDDLDILSTHENINTQFLFYKSNDISGINQGFILLSTLDIV